MHSPLKYPGGKFYLAKKIVSFFPPHLHYVEPYAGSLAVLLEREEGKDWMGSDIPSHMRGSSELVNDIDGELMNFWMVLSTPSLFERFHRRVEACPFSESLWEESKQVYTDSTDPVEQALAFFIFCRQSRAGSCKSFAPITKARTRGGINEQVSAWISCVEGLPEIAKRLRKVLILKRPAVDVIKQEDRKNTLFYLDPPYHPEVRTPRLYRHEMTEEDHVEMLSTISSLSGKFILSGYTCPTYQKFEKRYGWRRHDIEIPNHLSFQKTKSIEIESLWMNF